MKPMPSSKLSADILGAAMAVQDFLGPGLLESSYARCLRLELKHRGIPFESEVWVDVVYCGECLPRLYRMDLVVADQIVVEIKATSTPHGAHKRQVLTYLRHSGHRLGLLINFNAPSIKEGTTRLVL